MQIRNPSADYAQVKEEARNNAVAVIEELVNKSGLDVNENHTLVSQYDNCVHDTEAQRGTIRSLNGRITLLLLLVVVVVLGGIALICSGIVGFSSNRLLVLLVFPGAAICSVIVFPIRKLQRELFPALEENKTLLGELNQKASEAEAACWDNIAPFLERLTDRMPFDILERTLEGVIFDSFLDEHRAETLQQAAPKVFTRDLDQSTCEVLSGEYCQGSFAMRKNLTHCLKEVTYSGEEEVTVYYEEWEESGEYVEKSKTETLTAEYTAPKPFYDKVVTPLVFVSEEVCSLSFTHQHNPHYNCKNRAERERMIQKNNDTAKRLFRKRMCRSTDGKVFTPLANTDFEGLFAAFNRNSEHDFRLMFTPTAQENMVALIESFGDYFDYTKSGSANNIDPVCWSWDMDTSVCRYMDRFDFSSVAKSIQEDSLTYFDELYKVFAPIFCIPLFRKSAMQRSVERFPGRSSEYMAEVFANAIGAEAILGHPIDKSVKAMITASKRAPDGDFESFKLDIFYYEVYEHVHTASVCASDGQYHDVDVDWYEYVPIHKYNMLHVCLLDMEEGLFALLSREHEFEWNCPHVFKHGLLAWVEREDEPMPSVLADHVI